MRTLTALLRATATMRAMYPTERERDTYAYFLAGTAMGLAACLVAFPSWQAAPDETKPTETEDYHAAAA